MPNLSTDHSNAVLVENEDFSTGATRKDRFSSFNAADFAVPTGHEEDWRFTPMDRVADFFDADLTAAAVTMTSDSDAVEVVDRRDPRLGIVGIPDDRSSAVAWEAFKEAYIVTVPEGSEGREIVVGMDTPEGMHAAHVAIIAEAGSKSTVVLEHTGVGELNEGLEISVGEEAELTVVSVQEAERSARHFSSQRLRVGRNAKVRHIVVTLGGDVVRISTNLSYEDQGGDAELLGAYVT